MDEERLDALFEEAATIPQAERARWLDENCGGDAGLRRELERLLTADAIADGVLEHAPDLLARSMADAFETPQRFGIWRVLGALGAGGMGEVWLAERDDGEFRQRAAIKQVAWPTPGLLQRFRTERQILAGLEHPGIARLIDGGVDNHNCPWLAMEYVEGRPIAQWVHEHTLDVRATVELVLRICDAVQFAHRNLVVHSDIKPSNILVTADGVPKLLDFGIARVLAEGGDGEERTRTVAQLMTPDYAAPEMLAGHAITTSVDVYALGVLLYELLSGNRPYRLRTLGGVDALDTVNIRPPGAAVDRALPDANARRRALRGDLDRIVLTAMARETQHRYASVEALSTDLRNWLAGRAIAARGHGRWYRFSKFTRRNRISVAAVLLVFATLVAATAYSLHEAQLARAQAGRADAVRDFVVGVFEQTDPDARQGKPISAHELLDMGANQLQNEPRPQPFRTEMQGLIGHLYWLIGDYPKAISLIRGAIAHPDAGTPTEVRAKNLYYLAHTELEKGLFSAARMHALQSRALAVQAGNPGAETASAARLVYAESLIDDGNSRAAEPVLRQALKEDIARFGERSQAVADDWAQLASTAQTLARYDDSIAYSRRALAIETALHGRDSSNVMMGFLARAETEVYAGDSTAAERDQLEAVDVATKLYGPTHTTTLSMRANLYMIYALDEHYTQALAGHLDVLRLTQSFAGTRPEQLAYDWDGVAVDYLGLGRYDEALQAARQSMSAWARMQSPDSEMAGNDARTVLAEILMAMGRLDDAEATFREAIRIEGKNEPASSDFVNRDLAFLGNVYRLQHRYPEALAITARALRALSPRLGPTRRHAFIELMLAQAQLDAGDVVAAQRTAAQATQTASIAYGKQPLAFSAYQYANARVALAQGNPAEAERFLRIVFAARKTLPTNDYRKVEAQVGLIRALELQGKLDEAKSLRAKVQPVLAASKSPYFADLRNSMRQQ